MNHSKYLIRYLPATTISGKTTLGINFEGYFVNGHVRQNQAHIFLPDESVFVEIVTKKT